MINNANGVSLALAVWLVHDDYDYVDQPNYISATRLMKPLRQLVLPHRIPMELREQDDVENYVARALGHSLHDSIEKAWTKGYKLNLAKLGYPKDVIDRVVINPEGKVDPDKIAIYIEQRATRQFMGCVIGGKFDMVAEGIVMDNKSTSAYSWVHGNRDEEHQLQGSIYRWLNPDKITEDFIRINYIFTDWQKAQAKTNPKYPQSRIAHKDIPLLSLADTEKWIANKISNIALYMQQPEPMVPFCTPDELWLSEPVHKYYSDPNKTTGRSTKNFDTAGAAKLFMVNEKGGKGVVITTPGEPKRCGYCEAFPICTQKDKYFS